MSWLIIITYGVLLSSTKEQLKFTALEEPNEFFSWIKCGGPIINILTPKLVWKRKVGNVGVKALGKKALHTYIIFKDDNEGRIVLVLDKNTLFTAI